MKQQAHLHLPLKMTLEHLAQDVNQFFSWRMGLDSVAQVIHGNHHNGNNEHKDAWVEINLAQALKIKSGFTIRMYLSLTASGMTSIVSLPVHEEYGWNLGIRALEYVGWINNATHMTYGNKTKAFSLSHFLAYPVLGPYSGEHNVEKWLQDLDEEQQLGEQLDILYEQKMDSQIEQSFMQLLKNNDFKALNGKINAKLSNRLMQMKTQITDNHFLHHSLKSMMALLTDNQESIEAKTDSNSNNNSNLAKNMNTDDLAQSKVSSVKIKKFYQRFNKKSRYENEELLMNPLNVLSAFFYNVDDKLGDRMARHISFNNKENFVLPIHQYWKKAVSDGNVNTKVKVKAKDNKSSNGSDNEQLSRKKLPQLLDSVFSADMSTSMKQAWSKSKLKLQEKMPTYARLFENKNENENQKENKNVSSDLSNRNEKHLDSNLNTASDINSNSNKGNNKDKNNSDTNTNDANLFANANRNKKYKVVSIVSPPDLVIDDFMEDVELLNHSHEKKSQVIEFLNKQQKIKALWKHDNMDCFYGNPLRAAITHSNYKLVLWLAQNSALIVDKVDLRECIKPIYVTEKWFAQVNMPLLCLLFTTIHPQINKKHLQALLVLLLTTHHQESIKGNDKVNNINKDNNKNNRHMNDNLSAINPLRKDSRGLDSIDIILHNRAISKKDKVCYLKMMMELQPELKQAILLKIDESKNHEAKDNHIKDRDNNNKSNTGISLSEKMRGWLKTELEKE